MRYRGQGVFVFAVTIVALTISPALAQDRVACADENDIPLTIIATHGDVSILTSSGRKMGAVVGSIVCAGDEISTGASSSAEIGFAHADTTIGISSSTKLVVPRQEPDNGIVELILGRLRVLSSVRDHFSILTPLVNAGIDGTEAVAIVDGPALDTLFLVPEGVVTATDRRDPNASLIMVSDVAPPSDEEKTRNAAGASGFANQSTILIAATPDNVPEKFRELVARPERASDWAIYYPPVLLAAAVDNPAITEAAALLESGDPDAADHRLSAANLAPRDAGAALALRTIIAVFQNRTDDGVRFATEAVAQAPALGAAHIAQSYALQAIGELEAARDAAGRAVAAAPEDAYAWARLAELHLTIGERGAGRDAVARSLEVQETALGRAIEGFAEFASDNFNAATAAFNRAIEIDSEAPLPRLGLGLVMIRRGDSDEGRREIEAAVALDPSRANLRTWLARAYHEEGLGDKAAAQLALAKAADPDDPNAYFFSALQLFADNRPIEALRDLEGAQNRSASRAVVRSDQGLGEDRATRSSALARIYDVLGLEQLAVTEGARAVYADPTSPTAHRFLGDIFRTQQATQIVQSSETLKSDLLSMPSRTPLQPQLGEADLALLDTTGPTRVTFNEFAPAFNSNGIGLDLFGTVGTQETYGDEASATFLYDNVSLALGQLYYETEGYRANNDVEHQVYGAQARYAPAPWLTLFGEYRRRLSSGGDRRVNFDITDFNATLRQTFEREIFRAGIHVEPSPSTDILGIATFGDLTANDEIAGMGGTDSVHTHDDFSNFQLQGIQRFDIGVATIGGSVTSTDVEARAVINFPGFPPFIPPSVFVIETDRDVDQYGVYGYLDLSPWEWLDLTFGLSYDIYDDPDGIGRRDEINPKVGARIHLTDGIQVRAAYTRTTKPRLVAEQLLEPTTVMGFAQFADVTNGGVLELAGGAIDIELSDSTRIGAEGILRWWDNPATGGGGTTHTDDYIVSGYAEQSFTDRWVLTMGGRHEHSESDFLPDLEEFNLTSFPVSLKYFDLRGLFGSATVEPVLHDFVDMGVHGDDQFVMVNAAIGYRLPNELGVLSLEAQNILDQDVGFQERNFRRNILLVPRFPPSLTVMARATFRF